MANFGTVALPVSFAPQTAFPLDSRYYFDSLESAQSAAANAVEVGSSDGTYFIGQNVVVVTASEATLYVIQPDKTLKAVGSSIATDDKSIALTDGVVSLKNFGVKYQRYVPGSTEDEPGHYEETAWNDGTNPAPSGLEVKVVTVAENQYELAYFQPNPTTIEGVASELADIKSQIANMYTKNDVYNKTEIDNMLDTQFPEWGTIEAN